MKSESSFTLWFQNGIPQS